VCHCLYNINTLDTVHTVGRRHKTSYSTKSILLSNTRWLCYCPIIWLWHRGTLALV